MRVRQSSRGRCAQHSACGVIPPPWTSSRTEMSPTLNQSCMQAHRACLLRQCSELTSTGEKPWSDGKSVSETLGLITTGMPHARLQLCTHVCTVPAHAACGTRLSRFLVTGRRVVAAAYAWTCEAMCALSDIMCACLETEANSVMCRNVVCMVYLSSFLRMTFLPRCPRVTPSFCPQGLAERELPACPGRNRPQTVKHKQHLVDKSPKHLA